MWLNKRQLHSHFVFPQVPPGRGCKQSQPVLGTHLSKSFVFNLSSNLLELMMAVPPNSGWIFIYESLGKGKTKAERKSLLTFPVPLSSSSPWQALSPWQGLLTRFFLGKASDWKGAITQFCQCHFSAQSHGEGAEGTHLIPHSLHETQLHCISQQIFCAGKKQELDYTSWFLNKLSFASAGVSGLTPWFKHPTSRDKPAFQVVDASLPLLILHPTLTSEDLVSFPIASTA